jgi:hypothetical protein
MNDILEEVTQHIADLFITIAADMLHTAASSNTANVFTPTLFKRRPYLARSDSSYCYGLDEGDMMAHSRRRISLQTAGNHQHPKLT